jgi:putative ABC transport system permease protein
VSYLASLRDRLAGPVRPASLVLMALVALVLLIACANVAHLLLSRTTERRQELALRTALGASRARLVQQLVTEAMVLTAAAAAAGLGVAHWTIRVAASAQPASLASGPYTLLDLRVAAFAVGVAAVTGIIFGVLPAALVGRAQTAQEIVRGMHHSGPGRVRGILIAVQAALTVALVAGSITVGRSFLNLLETNLGYRTDRIVTLRASVTGTRDDGPNPERRYYLEALTRLRAVPGVESAGVVSYLPLVNTPRFGFWFRLDNGVRSPIAMMLTASPGYLPTMGMHLVEGRDFNENDRDGAEPVVIVTEDFATAAGGGRLVGRKLEIPVPGKTRIATIVGVIRRTRDSGPADTGSALVFEPIEQQPWDFGTFVARVRGNPAQYLAVCRDAVQRADPEVPVYDVKTMDRRLADTLARPRFYTTAIVFFAGFALLLAAVGIYGAAAHGVARRTHEIGVRIAVGASPAGVRGMLLGQSMVPVAAGVGAGIAAAAGLGRFLRHLIVGAEAAGLWICTAAALLLAATAAVAVWTATARVVRVDPIETLRTE